MKKKYFYCMMMCLAVLLVGCSDDEVNVPDDVIPVLKGSIGTDLTITRLGFGSRGNHSNEGVTGLLDNRYVCVKRKKYTSQTNPKDFVTGFGVKVDNRIGQISRYTEEEMSWKTHSDSKDWYSAGLIHDDVECIYTKDKLNDF